MIQLTLYTTEGCHLCEDAHEMILSVAEKYPLDLLMQEIGDDDDLVARYGIRIPVVAFADGAELNWPFSEQQLEHLITSKISD
jgi:hypothetical protein